MTELTKKSSDGNESKSECCKPIISLTNDHHNNDTPYSKKDADNRISALTNEKIDKELKNIIDFTINHTLMETNATLDWKKRDKLTLQVIELNKSLIHQAEIKAKLSELRDINENWFLQYENRSFVEYFNNRIEALEKEILE